MKLLRALPIIIVFGGGISASLWWQLKVWERRFRETGGAEFRVTFRVPWRFFCAALCCSPVIAALPCFLGEFYPELDVQMRLGDFLGAWRTTAALAFIWSAQAMCSAMTLGLTGTIFLVQLLADETPSFLLLGAAVDFLVDGAPHWVIWVYMSLAFTWAVCDALLPNFFNIARVFDCNS